MPIVNAAGLSLIKTFEGLKLKAYPDPVSKGEPYTIGYGQTGLRIYEDTIWSIQQAEDQLVITTDALAKRIRALLSSSKFNNNQLAAMVSFAYQEGMATLIHVIHEVGLKGYADKILEYDVAGSHHIPGIKRRRVAERELFLTPIQSIKPEVSQSAV